MFKKLTENRKGGKDVNNISTLLVNNESDSSLSIVEYTNMNSEMQDIFHTYHQQVAHESFTIIKMLKELTENRKGVKMLIISIL